jgi:hypothetical protein
MDGCLIMNPSSRVATRLWWPSVLGLTLLTILLAGCRASKIGTVESFRATRDSGELQTARGYLADDPRVWYGEHTGEGMPWTLGTGRYDAWDEHFRSTSDLGPWQPEGDTVWAVATEWNEYYALTERQGISRYRITYFFDEHGLIKGYMISGADPGNPGPPSTSRIDEIEAWARANHPEEWEYLRPGGQLDPTGDRAQRTRTLINRWRRELGLPTID